MVTTYGFCGGGIIAEVFIRRLLDSGTAKSEQILVHDPNASIAARLRGALGVSQAAGNAEVASAADVLFLATPPPAVVPVLQEIGPLLDADRLVLSLAAAVSLALMEGAIGHPVAVVRLVVNTPAWVGRGMTAFACGRAVRPAQRERAVELLKVFGQVAEVPEAQMATVAALAAVGPTYIFPVIGALIEAGVAHGLAPALAQTLACQVVAGSAHLASAVPKSPQELAQMISLRTLDEAAVRELFGRAVTDARAKLLAAAEKVQAAAAGSRQP
jgi:pyrroline-5-carboxylate reductase